MVHVKNVQQLCHLKRTTRVTIPITMSNTPANGQTIRRKTAKSSVPKENTSIRRMPTMNK